MALADILVVDLTHVVAGPMSTKILCDLGARVIKIEQPAQNGKVGRLPGDMCRYLQPRGNYFAMLNTGKESIALQLDPKHDGAENDRQLFEQLLFHADVLVENFRPGVLESLGYSWETLHQRYPKLILASISGFGQTGPYSHRKAVDTIVQGMSGFIASTGFKDTPVKVGTVVSDLLSGVYCATGVLTAIHHRHQHGCGSRVDISMLDASVAFHHRELANCAVMKSEPPRSGNTSPIGVYPFDVFECADGNSFSIMCGGDRDFTTFCHILGVPGLPQDPRFASAEDRWVNKEELRNLITSQTLTWKRSELLQKLLSLRGSESFPVGPVNGFGDIMIDPQLKHRNMLLKSASGEYTIVGNPIKIISHGLQEAPAILPDPPAFDADGQKIRAEFGRHVGSRSRL